MEAVQFDVELQDDLIPVPSRYRAWHGRRVKVILLSEEAPESTTVPRSAIEILAQTPKHRLFKSADDVDHYIRSERDQWDS
ncbi:MAG: hypothetical protein C1943_18340 [Halochromatium sp.]|nr:hypothetical protein [Halochromatium sp.]